MKKAEKNEQVVLNQEVLENLIALCRKNYVHHFEYNELKLDIHPEGFIRPEPETAKQEDDPRFSIYLDELKQGYRGTFVEWCMNQL